jgi:hypothetical protein
MSSLSVWVDESEKGDILVVAGVLVDWTKVPSIVNGWCRVKADLGLPPEAEIKWNLPSGHPTRQLLEQSRKTTKDLRVKVTDFVARRDDLSCIAVVMLEKRRDISFWRKWLWPKASVRDFYCEGLKYLIQRVAEEVVEAKLQDCVVVCDTPELGTKPFDLGSIRRGPRAVEETYRDWYRHGVSVGPGKKHHRGPLAGIGFHPSILIGDATYHDMLQVADVVAGITGEWVHAVRSGRDDSWEVDCFKAVSVRFRTRHGNPDFFGDGFVLWPWDNELWTLLQRSVR